jgi:hypothetical protein
VLSNWWAILYVGTSKLGFNLRESATTAGDFWHGQIWLMSGEVKHAVMSAITNTYLCMNAGLPTCVYLHATIATVDPILQRQQLCNLSYFGKAFLWLTAKAQDICYPRQQSPPRE